MASVFDLDLDKAVKRHTSFFFEQKLPPQKDSEFEIKYLAQNGFSDFSRIFQSLPILTFRDSALSAIPRSDVFLWTPDFFYKAYHLFNIGLDTPDGFIGLNGHQLRLRVSVRGNLPAEAENAIGLPQVTLKNLFSGLASSDRKEIEATMRRLEDAVQRFLFHKKDDGLPAFFNKLADPVFRVLTAFMTQRAAYMMGVYVPDEGAVVAFEVSNDKVMNITPDLLQITKAYDHEVEFEAKAAMHLQNPGKQAMSRSCAPVVFAKAEHILRAHLDRVMGDHLIPSEASKFERALAYTQDHYRQNAQMPFTTAANSNIPFVTMQDIAAKTARIRELAQQMGPTVGTMTLPEDVQVHTFDVDRKAALRCAHG